MGESKADKRKRLIRRLQKLWDMMPDESFGHLLAVTFGLNDEKLEVLDNDAAFKALNDSVSANMDAIYKTKLHARAFENDDNRSAWDGFTSDDYTNAQQFLLKMKKYVRMLTKQEYTSIKGLALNGDVEAAYKGLMKIVEKKQRRTAL